MILDNKINFLQLIKDVKFEMIFVIVVGFITAYSTNYFSAYIPEMAFTIPAFLGTAISILLSFKMGQSYERWWEARKIWGAIVNDSRTFTLQLISFLNFENSKLTISLMANRQIAWCFVLTNSLRNLETIKILEQRLSDDDQISVSKHKNKSLGILNLNVEELKSMRTKNLINDFTHIQLDNTITRLCDSMGKAERIKSTIFPPKYREILRISIFLFAILFTISLKNVGIIFSLPLVITISFIFLLLEKSAIHLQDPFDNKPTDTPMLTISSTKEINIKQLLKEDVEINPKNEDNYFIM